MRRVNIAEWAGTLGAAALIGASTMLPLWSMQMKAPQYPKGLRLDVYGTRMAGDVREINILNHYVGVPPLEAPQLETSLFPLGIALLLVLCVAAPLHRSLRRLAVAALAATPVLILADLQWRLYTFGHSVDPQAPIRLKPFTPPVIGTNTMWNFETSSMISGGIVCLLAAAALLALGGRRGRTGGDRQFAAAPAQRRSAAAALLALFGGLAASASAQPLSTPAQPLQARMASARPGSTIVVDGGVHRGPIRISGPLTVLGRNNPVIDGQGSGSVVTIAGHEVVFHGFVVRNSGRDVTEEAAGISVTGDRHRIERNTVRDVYFGIHIAGGAQHVIEDNVITPGVRHGARPGHGVSVWHARGTVLRRNHITHARDGIYLSFTEGVRVEDNDVAACRYGLHSMYSQHATFAGNRLRSNLLGAALMLSDKLVLRGNRIERHREGPAAYGVLLKDIGDLRAEENVILANRVGIYAEAVPSHASRQAVVARNIIAGHEVGLALQSNATLTVAGNRIADNLTDVRALGRQLSPGIRWSQDGRGNVWSRYRGYDADRNGIGDVPHVVDDAMEALTRRNPLIQAFLYTPAHLAMEAAVRMFPLLRQPPLLTDEHPLMPAWRRPR